MHLRAELMLANRVLMRKLEQLTFPLAPRALEFHRKSMKKS